MFRGYFKEFKCHNIWLTGKKCPYKKIVKFWYETSKNYHCRCRTWGCKCLCPQVNATFSQKIKTALSFPELSFRFPELSFCLSEVFIYLMFLFFKNGFCHRWLYVLLFLLKAAQRDLLGWIWIVNFLKDIPFLRMQVNFFYNLVTLKGSVTISYSAFFSLSMQGNSYMMARMQVMWPPWNAGLLIPNLYKIC